MKKKYNLFAEIFGMVGNVCPICGYTEWKFDSKEEIRDNVKIHVMNV
jgi:hypothetical protein